MQLEKKITQFLPKMLATLPNQSQSEDDKKFIGKTRREGRKGRESSMQDFY